MLPIILSIVISSLVGFALGIVFARNAPDSDSNLEKMQQDYKEICQENAKRELNNLKRIQAHDDARKLDRLRYRGTRTGRINVQNLI